MTKQVLQQALEALLAATPVKAKDPQMQADAIVALREALAQPEPLPPPPECQTEAEKTAYAFGWFKALEVNRAALAQQGEQPPVAWRFVDDYEVGHVSYSSTPPTSEQVAYLKKWNRPAWEPLYAGAAPAAQPTWREELLVKEMRYIAGISNGQVKRVAERALEKVKEEARDVSDD